MLDFFLFFFFFFSFFFFFFFFFYLHLLVLPARFTGEQAWETRHHTCVSALILHTDQRIHTHMPIAFRSHYPPSRFVGRWGDSLDSACSMRLPGWFSTACHTNTPCRSANSKCKGSQMLCWCCTNSDERERERESNQNCNCHYCCYCCHSLMMMMMMISLN